MDSDSPIPANDWFAPWVETHYARIQRAAFALCGNSPDADDLAQETFLRLLRSGDSFAGRSSPETWLYAILLNVHRQRCRTDRRLWRRFCQWWELRGATAVSNRPENELATREWNESIWGAVARLPVAQRHVIVLRYGEQVSYEEIAEVLACPIGTVRSRLHSATATLRAKIARDAAIPPVTEETTPCLAR